MLVGGGKAGSEQGPWGQDGQCHSLGVRLVKGQAHLVQVGGHRQARSASGKKGSQRKEGWARAECCKVKTTEQGNKTFSYSS